MDKEQAHARCHALYARGGPMRESLAENALSRALNIYVCPACGMDEALRDAAGKVLPISEWYAVKQHRLAEHKNPQAIKLTPACAFTEIFCGARRQLPLSSARYPISLVAYSRSDYDGGDGGQPGSRMKKCAQLRSLGRRSTPSSRAFRPAGIQNPVGDGPWCRLYAQPTNEPTEFNLYAGTALAYLVRSR